MIKVCGDNSYPPFEFTQDNGIFKGFNVDILNSIANETGIEIVFKPKRWEEAISCVRNGECQAIQGIALNKERLEYFDFTERYLSVHHSLFTLASNQDSNSISSILNDHIAFQKGDICFNLIKKKIPINKPLHITLVNNQQIALEKLFEKEVNAIAGNNLTVSFIADKIGRKHLIKVVGEPLQVNDYCIAVKKGQSKLLESLNQGIKAIKLNGVYNSIYHKWFGKEIGSMDSQIIESFKAGVICINNLGDITAVNNAACDILNSPKDLLLSQSFFYSPLKSFFNTELIQETLNNGKPFIKEISYLIDDIKKYLTINSSPLLDPQNNVIGAVINFRDITKEKEMEDILITRDKMKSIGILLLTIVHEIRNPLTSIKNFIDMMPTHLDDEEFRSSLLCHVPAQIKVIDELLRKLLEYSKPQKPVVKNQYVSDIITSIINKIHYESSIDFIINLPPNFTVQADEFHFHQIILNIILNSIEALGKTGIIRIEGFKKNNINTIEISDNGKGISKEKIPHLFEPFFTTKEEGTGLGLYIVHQLLKENNSNIEIESDQSGTKTTIYFNQIDL